MNRIPLYQIDAFADEVFRGNPAAVCPLDGWLTEDQMQRIAAENNLSETAFFLRDRSPVPLRWFTPATEVQLCGHATLASAFVLFEHLGHAPDSGAVTFDTVSGPLHVRRSGEGLEMDFPAIDSERLDPAEVPKILVESLGLPDDPREVRLTHDWNYLVVVDSAEAVVGARPDLSALETLHPRCVSVTAPGEGSDADFVSRYFAPSYGIPEDPVTGSLHCALAPYWAARLGRNPLAAAQLSRRGGRLTVEVRGERVLLGGRAVTYLVGEVFLP